LEILKQEEKVLSVSRKVSQYANKLDILEEFALAGFSPGTYWLVISLQQGGQVLQTEKEPFEITSVSSLPRPWVYSRTLSPVSHPGYSFVLGKQYLNQGKFDLALIHLEKAFKAQPNSQECALVLAQAYLAFKEYDKAKSALLPFQDSPTAPYDVLFTLGQVHQALGEYEQSVSVLEKAMAHHGVNTNLLNVLGESHYRRGNIQQALAAWEKSLELNPEQKDIKEKVESLKK
jgi:tetratricopeptide (TPR) repeat protein